MTVRLEALPARTERKKTDKRSKGQIPVSASASEHEKYYVACTQNIRLQAKCSQSFLMSKTGEKQRKGTLLTIDTNKSKEE